MSTTAGYPGLWASATNRCLTMASSPLILIVWLVIVTLEKFVQRGISEIEDVIRKNKQYGTGKEEEKDYRDITCQAAEKLTQFFFTNRPHARENKGYWVIQLNGKAFTASACACSIRITEIESFSV